MDQELIMLSEGRQTKENEHMIPHIRGLQKTIQVNLYTTQKLTHRHRKQRSPKGRGKGMDKLGAQGLQIKAPIQKIDEQQGLTV